MKACLFDLDGCLYKGNRAEPGAVEGYNRLVEQGVSTAFITNNSVDSPDSLVEKLTSMGFAVGLSPVFTPSALAGDFLFKNYGSLSLFALGSSVLQESLVTAGHQIDKPGTPDAVVVSRCLKADISNLQKAVWYLQHGAFLVATNLDSYHPGEEGKRILETGAIVSALQAVVPQRPVLIGKPGPYLFERAVRFLGVKPEQVLMVGDNPFTDILGGAMAGMNMAIISSTLSSADLGMNYPRITSLLQIDSLMHQEEYVG